MLIAEEAEGAEGAAGADTDTLPFVVEYTAKASGVLVRLISILVPFILSRQDGIELGHDCTLKICTPVIYCEEPRSTSINSVSVLGVEVIQTLLRGVFVLSTTIVGSEPEEDVELA